MLLEANLLQVFSSMRLPILTEFFSSVTLLGSAIFSMLLITGIYISGRKALGRFTALSYGLMAAVVYPLKFAVSRPRPDISNQLIQTTTQHSFPSGHTASAFVLATMLSYEKKEMKYVFFGLAGLVGFSRIYLGVHYPSDVFVGALIGYSAGKIVLKYRGKINSLIRMGDNSLS